MKDEDSMKDVDCGCRKATYGGDGCFVSSWGKGEVRGGKMWFGSGRTRGRMMLARMALRRASGMGSADGGSAAKKLVATPPKRHKSMQSVPKLSEDPAVALKSVRKKVTEDGFHQRVVTYNVLSSTLSQSNRFPRCAKENLDSALRLKRVLSKLEAEVKTGTVICLQEISMSWSGPISDFFSSRGYKLCLGISGSFYNGYLGVGIAYPGQSFVREEECVKRLGGSSLLNGTDSTGDFTDQADHSSTMVRLWRMDSQRPNANKKLALDEWAYSRSRNNIFMLLRLRCLQTGALVCFSTYHMPCAYFAPKVMVIHAALAAQLAQSLARGDPLVLSGDFNFKHHEPAYELITSGSISEASSGFPDLSRANGWRPELPEPLISAYAKVNGHEPDFTNYAHVSHSGLFVDCLDYIFVSQSVRVLEVDRLPRRDEVAYESLPTEDEPSDHLMIGATVEIPTRAREAEVI